MNLKKQIDTIMVSERIITYVRNELCIDAQKILTDININNNNNNPNIIIYRWIEEEEEDDDDDKK